MKTEDWILPTIDECCDVLDNKRIPINAEERENRIGDIPYYGANGLQGYIDDFIFDEPLILIAEDGGMFNEFRTRPIAYRIFGKSWVNNHAHVLRAKNDFCQDAIFYALEHKDIQSFIVGGTRAKLNQRELRSITILLPKSKPEQSKIAEILSTVDKAIEQTEALIAKQQRIKTGLMQDLLTKGIDENGNLRSEKTHKFKDSPLGRIPEEWECCQFGEFIELLTDYHANGSYERLKEKVNLLSEPNYAVMIRTLNLEKNDFDDLIFITQEAYEFLKKSYVNPGDLLMNKIANAGAIYLMPDLRCPVSTAMNLFLIRTDQRILFQEFAYYFLCLHQPYVRSFAKGTTTKTITKNAVKNLFIHKPNIKEQEVIIFLIRTQCHIILTLCNNFKKLQSIKTALMQDLLTGKVRVTPLLNNEVQNE